MKTVSIPDRVESETETIKLGFCVEENDEGADSWTYVEDMTEEQLKKVADRFKTTPEFITEVSSHFDSLREAVHNDLASIWDKVN